MCYIVLINRLEIVYVLIMRVVGGKGFEKVMERWFVIRWIIFLWLGVSFNLFLIFDRI